MGVKNNNSGKEKSNITDLDNMTEVDGSRLNLMVLVVLVHIKMSLYLLSSLSYNFSSVRALFCSVNFSLLFVCLIVHLFG